MIDFTWKVFSQTGNIETYLLLKELEKDGINSSKEELEQHEDGSTVDTKM
ncbi:YqzL family protein [Oceanobacillus halotolerans]|nr:YqzL family protein [Oceanobacillus halotolerans]